MWGLPPKPDRLVGELQFEDGIATGSAGESRPAIRAACTGSEHYSTQFHIFQIEGQAHFHLECVGCGTSFCPFGACG